MRMFVKCGTFPVCTNRGFYFIILHIFINRTLKVCAIHTSLPVPYISYFWQLLHHPPHPPLPPPPGSNIARTLFLQRALLSGHPMCSLLRPHSGSFSFIISFFLGGGGLRVWPDVINAHDCYVWFVSGLHESGRGISPLSTASFSSVTSCLK